MKRKKWYNVTNEKENTSYHKQNICYICKKKFSNHEKKDYKISDHCHYTGKYRGDAHNDYTVRYKSPKDIPVVFHDVSKYDYPFINKELSRQFRGKLECVGEKKVEYITFSVPINEELKNGETITYKLKFNYSIRFMSSPLSSLVDNIAEGLHNNKWKG